MGRKVHFIAIGGSIMHSLAIALKQKGYVVTGSDDEIFEPAKSTLDNHGLLPSSIGWNVENITSDLEFVIVGMHAKSDNPELARANELGVTCYSFPELIFNESKQKQRIVIAGSHGKTSITSMILHVLNDQNKKFDYAVGAKLEGIDNQVKLTHDAPIIIIEGDEYLTSPTDLRPKFLNYHHHIAVISGIAWDHFNVYPEFPNYVDQFRKLIQMTPKAGSLIYFDEDKEINRLVEEHKDPIFQFYPYHHPKYEIKDGITYVDGYSLKIFGKHNLENMEAARLVCEHLGVHYDEFFTSISSFAGAARRLELIHQSAKGKVYKDFAHAPSKVKATTKAVKEQNAKGTLTAFFELHTFSSLNKEFMSHYQETLNAADQAYVYYNPETVALKRLPEIHPEEVKKAFNRNDLVVFNDFNELEKAFEQEASKEQDLLIMSSGNFHNIDFTKILQSID